jgi:hypothetical protein
MHPSIIHAMHARTLVPYCHHCPSSLPSQNPKAEAAAASRAVPHDDQSVRASASLGFSLVLLLLLIRRVIVMRRKIIPLTHWKKIPHECTHTLHLTVDAYVACYWKKNLRTNLKNTSTRIDSKTKTWVSRFTRRNPTK